jgi:hypothetical protein
VWCGQEEEEWGALVARPLCVVGGSAALDVQLSCGLGRDDVT